MHRVTCSTGVWFDGYIVGPDGGFPWTAPDADVFRVVIEELRGVCSSTFRSGVVYLRYRVAR